jgi:hypothetical protein
MIDSQEPRPEFVSHLEWQLRTALQRGNRFSDPVQPSLGGKMKIMVLVLASALMGAGGVVVREEVQENRAQEILLTEIEGRLRLAGVELELVRAQLLEVEGLFETGAVDEEALQSAQVQVREAEVEYARLSLDREEVLISGKKPNDEISAPLLRGRDFVTERLRLRAAVAVGGVDLARQRVARYQELVASGMVEAGGLEQATLALQEAARHLESIQVRMDLRNRFLEERATALEVERELEIGEARADLELRLRALEVATGRFRALEERAEAGLVTEREVKRARLEQLRHLLEVDLARARLDQLVSAVSGRGG